MGLFEKRRMKGFIEWVGTFDEGNSTTHKGTYSFPCASGAPLLPFSLPIAS
jgi:RAB protein geranylgeranyltransferase component A